MKNLYWLNYNQIRKGLLVSGGLNSQQWFFYGRDFLNIMGSVLIQTLRLEPLKRKLLFISVEGPWEAKLMAYLKALGFSVDSRFLKESVSENVNDLKSYLAVICPRDDLLTGEFYWSHLRGGLLSAGRPVIFYSFFHGIEPLGVSDGGLQDREVSIHLWRDVWVARLGERLEYKPLWDWDPIGLGGSDAPPRRVVIRLDAENKYESSFLPESFILGPQVTHHFLIRSESMGDGPGVIGLEDYLGLFDWNEIPWPSRLGDVTQLRVKLLDET